MQFDSSFALGQLVAIDGDDSIVGTITGFTFRTTRAPLIEVSWFHNGELKTGWIEESRLTLIVGPR